MNEYRKAAIVFHALKAAIFIAGGFTLCAVTNEKGIVAMGGFMICLGTIMAAQTIESRFLR